MVSFLFVAFTTFFQFQYCCKIKWKEVNLGHFSPERSVFSQASHVVSFSHYISEQKMMSIIPVAHISSSPLLAMRQFLLTSIIELNEFKKEIYSYKKRSLKGRKISMTYKKFREKRISAVQICQCHHFQS